MTRLILKGRGLFSKARLVLKGRSFSRAVSLHKILAALAPEVGSELRKKPFRKLLKSPSHPAAQANTASIATRTRKESARCRTLPAAAPADYPRSTQCKD